MIYPFALMAQLQFSSTARPKVTSVAIVNLCIALMAVSFAPIFIRFSETDLGANATVMNRMLVFLIVFGFGRTLRQLGRKLWSTPLQDALAAETPTATALPFTRAQWLLLWSVGLVSALSLGLWAISLEHTSVAKSMLLNNLTPVFASFGSWLLLGKRFDQKFIIGIAIAVFGAILLGIEDLQMGEADSLRGDAYALLSAVFLGGYFLIVEQLRSRFNATTILLWRCATGVAILIPFVYFTEGQLLPSTLTAGLAVLGLGLVSEGLGQNLLADCMTHFSSSFIALFLLLEPIVSAFLGWLFFAESLSAITGVGFIIILGGIYLAQSSDCAIQEAV